MGASEPGVAWGRNRVRPVVPRHLEDSAVENEAPGGLFRGFATGEHSVRRPPFPSDLEDSPHAGAPDGIGGRRQEEDGVVADDDTKVKPRDMILEPARLDRATRVRELRATTPSHRQHPPSRPARADEGATP